MNSWQIPLALGEIVYLSVSLELFDCNLQSFSLTKFSNQSSAWTGSKMFYDSIMLIDDKASSSLALIGSARW